ncbi:MAG TPA: carboxypeptidase regulatory-like domain-containing protein [Blastocatellia bacterium]|nr:carboxypeptidase regulatory-like domain-containing protein [Blastocatellia bacterium]
MRNRISLPGIIIFAFIVAALPIQATQTATGSLSGTIKDQTGAVITGAQVSIRNDATGETKTALTGDDGRFKFDKLAPGAYTVSVSQTGFKPSQRTVAIEPGRPASIEIRLEVVAPREKLEVGAKGTVAPNSEPTYRQLRDAEALETYTVNNLALKRDVGTITLVSGRVSFVSPVMGRVVKAVFVGEGQFTLSPAIPLERDYLRRITEKETVDEAFEKAVFCFTDETFQEIKRQAQSGGDESRARGVLTDFQRRVRYRTERPRSLLEYLLAYEGENLDAEILASLYNSKRPAFFSAYIFGRKYGDLRYHVRPRGALPQLLAPEEVALINVDPAGEKEGIWYLAHLSNEYKNRTASSDEDKRIIDAEHYRIETAIDSGEKLTAVAELTFTALGDGDRVLGFGLLPNLRVTRVTVDERETNFIQEPKKEDGSFYVVWPEPLVKGKQYKLSIEYQGNKVIEDAGGGNFAVGARTSWYPSVNAFNDRATFDLTFKVPSKYTVVGVGKLVKEWREGDFAASQWVSDVPLAVAGFNYGLFKKKEIADADTKYQIEGYATSDLPDYMRAARDVVGGLTPSRLNENAMVDAQNSMRVFTRFFGEAPYGRIAITQQPQFNFGQSWPTLVYLPISAYLDSTQRWMLLGRISSRLTEFIQEVTPHEVAHQWWGHIVGWASFHDQWLSEGFADFSAGLFLQATEKSPDKYLKYWEHQKQAILEKNQWGNRANDAGPIWMGLRLNTFKTGGAYARLVYPKGGYILHMLRTMMYNQKTGDQQFIDMMHDFVKTHFNQNASTESFKRVVEKHMTPGMDLDDNKSMDWFFNEWVYGTEVPRYRLEYSLTPESDGKVLLKLTVSQSGVSENFKMMVPIYMDFDGKWVRLGLATITGNATTQELKVRLPQKPKRVVLNAFHDVLAVESVSVQK